MSMRAVAVFILVSAFSMPVLAEPEAGAVRESDAGIQVWSAQRNAWIEPTLFFADDLKTLNGPTYGRTSQYPPYAQVKEWETLVDVLPDGRECPMVFFHQRWRRLPDVRALDERLRNYGGCKDVFKY